jgi:hypothetical protein
MARGESNAWPVPRAVSNMRPQNIEDCLRTIKLNSQALLDYMISNNVKANSNFTKFFKINL